MNSTSDILRERGLNTGGDGSPASFSDLNTLFETIVSGILSLGGIVLLIMLLLGGFKYITSGGDPKAAEGAKNTITYAIVGLVLLVGSYILLQTIGVITGVDLDTFEIYR